MLAAVILLGYIAAFGYAAVSDGRRYEIPNEVILVLLALFAVAFIGYPEIVDWRDSAIAGGVVFAFAAAAFFLGWIGAGDAKLLGLAALWVGLDGLAAWAMTLGLAGLVLTSGLLVLRRIHGRRVGAAGIASGPPRILRRGAPVPYGIAIATAALSAILTAPSLIGLWARVIEVT